jgi:hypothetical protein
MLKLYSISEQLTLGYPSCCAEIASCGRRSVENGFSHCFSAGRRSKECFTLHNYRNEHSVYSNPTSASRAERPQQEAQPGAFKRKLAKASKNYFIWKRF